VGLDCLCAMVTKLFTVSKNDLKALLPSGIEIYGYL
jgi:hypothetical protein